MQKGVFSLKKLQKKIIAVQHNMSFGQRTTRVMELFFFSIHPFLNPSLTIK